jgi:hypothetical protein
MPEKGGSMGAPWQLSWATCSVQAQDTLESVIECPAMCLWPSELNKPLVEPTAISKSKTCRLRLGAVLAVPDHPQAYKGLQICNK